MLARFHCNHKTWPGKLLAGDGGSSSRPSFNMHSVPHVGHTVFRSMGAVILFAHRGHEAEASAQPGSTSTKRMSMPMWVPLAVQLAVYPRTAGAVGARPIASELPEASTDEALRVRCA